MGDRAAHRGIQWIIDHRGEYPPEFHCTYLRRFYRITADDNLAKRLVAITGRIADGAPKCSIDDLASKPSLRNWSALKAVLMQVYQRQCSGKPRQESWDRIRKIIATHELEFFPSPMPDGQRLVAAYYLEKVGLRFRDSWDSVASDIRCKAMELGTVEINARKTLLLGYALTHVIFTKSDYFGQYVAASEYGPEIKALQRYVKAAIKEEPTEDTMDLAAECVTALKLLGQPLTDDVRTLCKRLMACQNPDGSWGIEASTTSTTKIHHTDTATMALLKFISKPRKRDPWCDRAWGNVENTDKSAGQ
jgi:hypothetical protein